MTETYLNHQILVYTVQTSRIFTSDRFLKKYDSGTKCARKLEHQILRVFVI